MNLKRVAMGIVLLIAILLASLKTSVAVVENNQENTEIEASEVEEKVIENGADKKDKKADYIEGEAIIMYRSDFTANTVKANALSLVRDYRVKSTCEFKGAEIPDESFAKASSLLINNTAMNYRVDVIESDTKTTKELIEELSKEPWVIAAEPNYIFEYANVTTSDTYAKYQWPIYSSSMQGGTDSIGINAFKTTSTKEKVVAILDSGVNYNLDDLKNMMWVNPYSQSQLKGTYGYDFCNNDTDPMDDYGHGTHCAGIVAAQGNNSKGVSGVTVGSPNIKIMALKIGNNQGQVNTGYAVKAYNYISTAQDLGTDVVAVNNSWITYVSESGSANTINILKQAIETVGAKGTLTACAVGNDSYQLDSNFKVTTSGSLQGRLAIPCGIKSNYIISVGATNQRDNIALFSNYGPSVSMGAPGVQILSTVTPAENNPILYGGTSNQSLFDYYQTFDNTVTTSYKAKSGSVTTDKSLGDGVGKSLKWTVQVTNSMLDDNGTYVTLLFLDIPVPAKSNISCVATGTGPVTTGGHSGETNKVHHSASLFVGTANNSFSNIVNGGAGGFSGTSVVHISGNENSFGIANIDHTPKSTTNALTFELKAYQAGTYTVNIDSIGILNLNKSNVKVNMNYAFMDGTSMATPHVAGAIGILSNLYENSTALERKNKLLSKGYSAVSALDGKVENKRRLNLKKFEITKIVIEDANVDIGESVTIKKTITPTTAADETIKWSSNNTSIATVNSSGKVIGLKTGTATITATTPNGKTSSCIVTVGIPANPVTSIKLNKNSTQIHKGKTEQLTATITPSNATNKTTRWSSTNEAIATVSDSGLVTAVEEGTTTIKVTAGGKEDSCTVTVLHSEIAVTSVTLNKTSDTIEVSGKVQLTATVLPENATNKTVTWSSADTSIATVSNAGIVTGKGAGTVQITATAGGESAQCTITVVEHIVPVTGISLNKNSLVLQRNTSEKLTATVSPEDATDKTVRWSSSNTDVAQVSSNGTVSGVGSGDAIIFAQAGDEVTTCSVVVRSQIVEVTGVYLGNDEMELLVNEELQIQVYIEPSNATNRIVNWVSSDPDTVTVDEDGMIIGVSPGEATVTAEIDGYEAYCEVYVEAEEVAVENIYFTENIKTINKGDSDTLELVIEPEYAMYSYIYWNTTDRNIVMVDDFGNIYGKNAGTATITARIDDKTATCEVTVLEEEVNVTSVILNKTATTLYEGETEQLTATVLPEDATNKTVTWESLNTDVAIINSSGLITAISEGTAEITATAGNKTATCTVTVRKVEVTSVSLNKTAMSLEEGSTEKLTATVLPENASDKTVSWESSKTAVATVTNSGLVRALRAGTTTITATAGSKTATCTVTVTEPYVEVTSISLNKASISLEEGETEQLTATVLPENATDRTVTWKSSKTSIATVTSSGLIRAVKKGTATITATAGEKEATCTVTVTEPYIAVTIVSLNKTEISIEEGQNEQLTAVVLPENATDKTVTWRSSKTSVATVTDSGLVQGVSAGTTTITATAGEKEATCTVTVTEPYIEVTSVNLNKTATSIEKGNTEQLTALVLPENATDKTVTWKSSKTGIVVVTNNGLVTGISAGTATITATAGEKKATCTVTVTDPYIPVTSVSLNKNETSIIEGETEQLTASVLPEDSTNRTVTWKSSNNFVASVSNAGLITANIEGEVDITASCDGKSASCTVTVKPRVILVTNVSLNKTEISIEKGRTEQLTATVLPENATDKTVTWISSDTGIAKVTNNGLVTGMGEGTATITAKAGDETATCSVEVTDSSQAHLTKEGLRTSEVEDFEYWLYTPSNATENMPLIVYLHGGSGKGDDLDILLENDGFPKYLKEGNLGDIPAYVIIPQLPSDIADWTNIKTSVRELILHTKDTYNIEENRISLTGHSMGGTGTWRIALEYPELFSCIAPMSGSIDNTYENANKLLNMPIWAFVGNNDSIVDPSYSTEFISTLRANNNNSARITIFGDAGHADVPRLAYLDSSIGLINWLIDPTDEEIFKATFEKDDGIESIDVYYTQTATEPDATDVAETVARDGVLGGILSDGNGQINFKVNPKNGYSVNVTVDGNYYNIEGPQDTGILNMYRVKNVSSNLTIHVSSEPIEVTEVQIDKSYTTIFEGETEQLTATVLPEDALNKTVIWRSSNNAVASVSNTGIVTANTVGDAEITASCGEKSASCTVIVTSREIAVTSITLNKTSTTLYEGEAEQLSATVLPEDATNKTVTWKSLNTDVAVVSNNGFVTAIAEGSTVVTATAGEKTALCTVTVRKIAVTSVSINKREISLEEGDVEQLIATVLPNNASDRTVTWSSSDTDIATVTNGGLVEGVSTGEAIITAKAGEKEATCTVTVTEPYVEVTSITLDKDIIDIEEGETEQLTATVLPENSTERTVTWESSDTTIAMVSSSGLITGITPGTVQITAEIEDKEAECTVTVRAKNVLAEEVIINKTSTTIKKGSEEQLTATVRPFNTTNKTITWRSENGSIATVNSEGVVSGIDIGTTNIYATCGSCRATCSVTIVNDDTPIETPRITSIVLNKSNMEIGIGERESLIATISPEHADRGDL